MELCNTIREIGHVFETIDHYIAVIIRDKESIPEQFICVCGEMFKTGIQILRHLIDNVRLLDINGLSEFGKTLRKKILEDKIDSKTEFFSCLSETDNPERIKGKKNMTKKILYSNDKLNGSSTSRKKKSYSLKKRSTKYKRRFICYKDGCRKIFLSSSGLRYHVQCKHDKIPAICPKCGKKLKYKTTILSHQKTKSCKAKHNTESSMLKDVDETLPDFTVSLDD